jgi:hypothetical protein
MAYSHFKSQPPVRNEASLIPSFEFTLVRSTRGQVRMYHDFLRPRQPGFSNIFLPKEYFLDGEGGSLPMITEELFQVIELKVEQTRRLCNLRLTYGILPATIRPGYFGD